MKAFIRVFGCVVGWVCIAVSALMFLTKNDAPGFMLAFLGGMILFLVSKHTAREKAAKAAREEAAAAQLRQIGKARVEARRERRAEEARAVSEERKRREEQARRNAESKPALLDRLGRQYEADGDIDKAISFYTQAVVEGSDNLHPYERLATLYRIRKEYAEELRVCTAAIQMMARAGQRQPDAEVSFRNRIAYDKAKLREGQ